MSDEQMLKRWDSIGRVSLDAASTATSLGFSAAKHGTKLGFGITRGIASSIASLTGAAVDHAVFGGSIGAGKAAGTVVSTAISALEALTLAPILIGESIASTTLVAAHSSLTVLQAVFPGSDEASFSLTSFVSLVRREWKEDMNDYDAPETRHGISEIMKALVAWAALQGITSEWQEKKWFRYLKELPVHDEVPSAPGSTVPATASQVHITADVVYPSNSGQIITADIGDATSPGFNKPTSAEPESLASFKLKLRRYSKLVLAGYGGASLIFFGVPPIPTSSKAQADEERKLAIAVGSSEVEASGGSIQLTSAERQELESKPGGSKYSWWDVLRGKHDKDILLHYAQSSHQVPEGSEQAQLPATPPAEVSSILGGSTSLMPRFWVLTDHSRQEIVLVLRGTMSLNELAVDLTCDPAEFTIRRPKSKARESMDEQEVLDNFDEELDTIPGSFPIDLSTPPPSPSKKRAAGPRSPTEHDTYEVHGGMLKMARAMGGRGKPVHAAVKHALKQNEGYSLAICGHSLGAGVAGILALMWADPRTCLTHRASGLPTNRRVAAYCYAPPCLVSAPLSRLAASAGLITSFVYSHDVVSRLSLGSVRDLRRAAAWLSHAEKEGRGEGYGGVTGRALKAKTGFGKGDDPEWFLAMRKTLEANMRMAHLFPPGRVLWAIRDGDLDPSHRLATSSTERGGEKVRLFEVEDVEQVFNQIVFAKDMLSSHLPHQYDRVLHELL
ncbi:lipase family protein [Phanerochaete sordida]|uniref:sn-1-specific diacylglycerol lipase n=1 Tax=Phanerochaete sordida TaxID=48140 RepID=A0A9P3FYT7_9APHY|nr:lipase family protein [Phanerochaete sordida]